MTPVAALESVKAALAAGAFGWDQDWMFALAGACATQADVVAALASATACEVSGASVTVGAVTAAGIEFTAIAHIFGDAVRLTARLA